MISSQANQQVKSLGKWMKSGKTRREDGVFLVEGKKMVVEAIQMGMVEKVYLTGTFLQKETEVGKLYFKGLTEEAGGALEYSVDGKPYLAELMAEKVFSGISDTVTPQGILAVAHMPQYKLTDYLSGKIPTEIPFDSSRESTRVISLKRAGFLVLENIQDPGNLGTMIRTAEGAGMSGILLSPDCVDPFSPKVVRSSMGGIFRVPLFCLPDLDSGLMELKKAGVTLYAAHLQGKQDYTGENWKEKAAILIGNEAKGLTGKTASQADVLVRIPMDGAVESLNASVAAALLMYEWRR